MDAHPAPTCHKTEDLIPGHRGAAVRETHEQVLEPLDVNTDLRIAAQVVADRVGLNLRDITSLEARDSLRNRPRRLMSSPIAASNASTSASPASTRACSSTVASLTERSASPSRRSSSSKFFPTRFDHVETSLTGEPLANLVARPGADGEAEPVWLGQRTQPSR